MLQENSLKIKLEDDARHALKSQEAVMLSTLRMVLSAIHNREIEKRVKIVEPVELTEEEILAVVRSEVKKRKDAIVEFERGGRRDLVEKERTELQVLERYLPVEFLDEEIKKIVQEVIGQLGTVTKKDFGRVMGETMKRVRGRASGDRVSAAVREELAAGAQQVS